MPTKSRAKTLLGLCPRVHVTTTKKEALLVLANIRSIKSTNLCTNLTEDITLEVKKGYRTQIPFLLVRANTPQMMKSQGREEKLGKKYMTPSNLRFQVQE